MLAKRSQVGIRELSQEPTEKPPHQSLVKVKLAGFAM